jgi:diguanylate cyclase (GGDEF)-like protein/PAS domain S-box-containing protein
MRGVGWSERAFMINAELFHAVLEAIWSTSSDAILVVDQRGLIVCCNENVEELLGWPPGSLVGRVVETLVPARYGAIHEIYRNSFSTGELRRRMGSAAVVKAIREDGAEVPVEVSLSAFFHKGQRYTVAMVRDASARHAYEEQLRELSFRDALTGVYNRLFMEEELDRLDRGRRWPISLIMLDVDGLKKANDTLGHERGDELIRRAACALSEAVRAEDFVARLGGDEFVAVLPGVGDEMGEQIVARVIGRCEQSPGSPPLRVSVGVATAHAAGELREAMRQADKRMYAMKRTRQIEAS